MTSPNGLDAQIWPAMMAGLGQMQYFSIYGHGHIFLCVGYRPYVNPHTPVIWTGSGGRGPYDDRPGSPFGPRPPVSSTVGGPRPHVDGPSLTHILDC